ncbi:MAG TPA: twin-arginine translocation pathway signal protein, partial [Thermoanaerobaculia bacterium]|nr:twin-arginine translocation pathway signal protein [Thermoanaerobaculia bacterium]
MSGQADDDSDAPPAGLSRRSLLSGVAAVIAGSAGSAGRAAPRAAAAPSAPRPRSRAAKLPDRLERARQVREAATALVVAAGLPVAAGNGDEKAIPDRLALFSKGLPHDRDGRVNPGAWAALARALESGDPADFETVPLGGFARLANPQAAWTYALIGPDPAQVACPPPPRFASDEQAAEMVEMYWQALLRDVPFSAYPGHPLAEAAAAELSVFP